MYSATLRSADNSAVLLNTMIILILVLLYLEGWECPDAF